MSAIYDAHPLNVKGSTNIRVIEVLDDTNASTNSTAPISCRLRVVSLDDDPVYTALSYVWGDESVTETILVDGQPYIIRKNLWNFLTQICLQERNHQVALMGQIYTRARLVIAWLGNGSGNVLQTLATMDLYGCSPDWHSYITNMTHLSLCGYWSRLWIIQEFVMGKKLEIWSDGIMVDGDVFARRHYRGVPPPQSFADENPVVARNFFLALVLKSSMMRIFTCRQAYHRQHNEPVVLDNGSDRFLKDEIFIHFCYAKCSDTRDRVYGLLGLLDQEELQKFPIDPDYSKSSSALFADVCSRHIQMSQQEPQFCEKVYSFASKMQLALELDEDENVSRVFARIDELRTAERVKSTGNNLTMQKRSNLSKHPKRRLKPAKSQQKSRSRLGSAVKEDVRLA